MSAEIKVFRSNPKQTPFAPEWNYFVAESELQGIDFNEIARIILEKEKEIVQNHPHASLSVDGYTGLGKDSLTSRWQHFNVFKWQEPEILKLKKVVYENYLNLLETLGVPRSKVYAQCWANVLRKGQDIKQHLHAYHPWTYLSGHITVQCDDTFTVYVNPVNQIVEHDPEVYYQKNIAGRLSFFPSHVPHFTTTHNGDKERITIAFDLIVNNTKKDGSTDYNTVPFDYAK